MRRAVIALFLLLGLPLGLLAQAPPVPQPFTPAAANVRRFGPAYRYDQHGWIVLHVEGDPYPRGYQYGQLLAPEIGTYIRALGNARSLKDPWAAWRGLRTLTNALFLRRYDAEYLEEMKGMADGAAAAGTTADGRPVDLLDMVVLNSSIEFEFLDYALEATPTGLEGKIFPKPSPEKLKRNSPSHCSAFAATGPATADGKVVFGHITMWTLFYARYFNVWVDIKPTRGHRLMFQTFPGGIMSGMDYYQNSAGMLLCETTIMQTQFDLTGWSLVSRVRKAMQYGSTIDYVVESLRKDNNGLYSNEWLIADTKTNEIAMFELGTHQNRLWRSSRDEWYGGTKGFYWGCNNAKDMQVRLETIPSVRGKPANLTFRPSDRDVMWNRLFADGKTKMDAAFGFKAFTTPPLAAFPSCDAKFTTTDLAKDLKSYALFGPPLGRTWLPTEAERLRYGAEIQPLVANDWTLLSGAAPPDGGAVAEDLAASKGAVAAAAHDDEEEEEAIVFPERAAAWRGTLLPKNPEDTWLAAAFADYERLVAHENSLLAKAQGKPLSASARDELAVAYFDVWSRYRLSVLRLGRDFPLTNYQLDYTTNDRYDQAVSKGVLLLAGLRTRMGAAKFDAMMDEFGRANAGQEVTVAEFIAHAERHHGDSLASYFQKRMTSELPLGAPRQRLEGANPARDVVEALLRGDWETESWPATYWTTHGFDRELDHTIIVYGTGAERIAHREAADRLQYAVARRWKNAQLRVIADTEVSEDDLKRNHVLLVGRPAANRVAARFAAAFPVTFGNQTFTLRDKVYAHPGSAVIAVGANPLNDRRCVVLAAGLSSTATWHVVERLPNAASEVVLVAQGQAPQPLVVALRPQVALRPAEPMPLPPIQPAAAVAPPKPASDLAAKLEEYLNAQAAVNHFSGVALVARGKDVLVRRAYGMANYELDVPNTPSTKFRIASVTKPFTAAAILTLVQQGKLKLDDPITKHLSDLPPEWSKVTIHHLLCHTAGMPEHTNASNLPELMPRSFKPAQIIDLFRAKPLDFTPGEKFKYSNSGYILLGAVIEAVTGLGYGPAMEKLLFAPLGLKDTRYDVGRVLVKGRASGYLRQGTLVMNAPYLNASLPFAAGGLMTTVDDLHAFMLALSENKVIDQDLLERMVTPNLENYGYGWVITRRFDRRTVGHTGGMPGFAAAVARYPDDGVSVIVLSNVQNTVAPGLISRDLAAIVFGVDVNLPEKK
jgi:CubicO group peptidase (beta-lactamase class C family)